MEEMREPYYNGRTPRGGCAVLESAGPGQETGKA